MTSKENKSLSVKVWLSSVLFTIVLWILQSKIEGFSKGEPAIDGYLLEYFSLIIISYISILLYTIPFPFAVYVAIKKTTTTLISRTKKIVSLSVFLTIYGIFTAFYVVEGILRIMGWRGEDNPDSYFYWFYLFAPLSAVISLLCYSNRIINK